MAIVLHTPATAALGPHAPKPTTTTPGQTEATRPLWSASGGAETGIWEATPGTFTATRTGYHEVCQILSGRATLTPDGGTPVAIGAGDLLVTPEGWSGTWEVHETLRKVYVVFDAVAG